MAETKPPPLPASSVVPASIGVRVLFFASLADLMGGRRRSIDLPAGATVADAVERLAREAPELAARAGHVSFAVNQAFVPTDSPLADGDELALIPPVSGG